MRKRVKKLLSVITAVSISASAFAGLTLNAFAEDTNVVKLPFYDDVTAPSTVTLIRAMYRDGVMVHIKMEQVTPDADGYKATEPRVGEKFFLWDMDNGAIKPLADAQTEEFNPEIIKSWKFDFGSETDVAEGYTYVAPDRNYTAAGDYGFLGTDENDYHLGNRYDGFGTQQGQKIELTEGGGTGLNDGVGSTGEDLYGNAGDKYYPTRFALKVQDEQYFRVRATVTTLDTSKPANASLYTERKHPLYTDRTIPAGEAVTTEFVIRTTPIYYEKSDPKGTIKDEMVNVSVCGENTALAALEIDQIDDAPTMWVLGDSTVTDGNCNLPFFRLQNYTGVGTGLTKYLPRYMAMVNEGEGGLNAADNNHFNMVKNRIKKGDYMYVEYGHNHKEDGPEGYRTHLDKYYNACHEVGAKLIIVSPVQSVNSWNDTEKRWNDRFGGETNFAGVGKAWVAEKVAAGAKDVAFVDLTKTSVEFVDKITNDNGGSSTAAKFYYWAAKGGGTDASHPNDMGAENFAYCFFKAAQEVTDPTQKNVLAELLANMTNETPNLVPQEIMAGGLGGTAWPSYFVPTDEEYPVQIKRIDFAEDGTASYAKVKVVNAKLKMETYGMIVITVKDADGNEVGKIHAIDQVDNSTGLGTQEIVNFTKDVKLPEGGSYTAMVWKALDTNDGLQLDPANIQYSWEYVPADIVEYLLPGQDDDIETFSYYGKESLNGAGAWTFGGNNGSDLTLGEDDEYTYATVTALGTNNSFYVMRPLENLTETQGDKEVNIGTGSSGKYMVSADIKYESGSGLTYALAKTIKNSSPFVEDALNLFTIGDSGKITANGVEAGTLAPMQWTNVQYILDMDNGTASISVAGAEAKVVDIPMYNTMSIPSIDTLKNFAISGVQKAACATKVANLIVAQLKQDTLPDKTIKVASNVTDATGDMGTVYIDAAGTTEKTVKLNELVKITAVPADGYELASWTDGEGNDFAFTNECTVRAHENMEFKAIFREAEKPAHDYLYYENFRTLTTDTLAANGWTSANAQGDLKVAADTTETLGNHLKFGIGTSSRGAVKTFASKYKSDKGLTVGMDIKFNKSNNEANQLVLHSGNIAYSDNNVNYGCAGGSVLIFVQTKDGTATLNGEATTIPDNTWVKVFAKCDFTTHKVNVTVTSLDGATSYFNGEVNMADTAADGLSGIYLRSARNNGVISMDNIEIYATETE